MLFPKSISLKRRVLNAGAWSLAGYGLNLIIRLGSNLVMTRILVPEMFGVMAIALMVLVGLALFSDVGLKPSVIQSRRGNEAAFLNTAWTTQILRGLLLWFLALNISLLIYVSRYYDFIPKSSVYENPSLPYVIAILSFSSVISSFESTKILVASRDLSIANITKLDLSAQIAGLLVMIGWGLADASIWALVAGAISTASVRTFLSHVWLPGIKNCWQWEHKAFQEIIGLGKWIFLSSALYFFATNGDRMLLGGLVDAASLGTYVIAFVIFSSIDQVLTKIIVDVSFPALSEIIREQPAKLTDAYYKFHAIIASFAYFCCGFLLLAGHTIVALLYDVRYQQAGWILEILAVALLPLPLRIATQCFLALGAARVYFYLQAIRIVTLFLAVPAGFYLWGFKGALWGIVLSYFSSIPQTIFLAARRGLFDLRRELFALFAFIPGLISGEALNWAIVVIRH
jgi:O-antigen/teichoic acid export membrane protein